MRRLQTWANQVERRLRRAGFKVTTLTPQQAVRRKAASRRRDRIAIETGRATQDQIQAKNSIFGRSFPKFRFVDYGGLDE